MPGTEPTPQRAAIRTVWVALSRGFGLVSGLFAFGLYVFLLVKTAQGQPVEPSRELLMLQYLAVIAFIVSGAWAWWTEHQIVKDLRRQLGEATAPVPAELNIVPKGFRGPALAFEAQAPRLLAPAAERRLIDALSALRNKHSCATIQHSSREQYPTVLALVEIFGKSRWGSSHSEMSSEDGGSPPDIGTEIGGVNPPLVSAVANALVEAGFRDVRTRHHGAMPITDEQARLRYVNTVHISLGHPQ